MEGTGPEDEHGDFVHERIAQESHVMAQGVFGLEGDERAS